MADEQVSGGGGLPSLNLSAGPSMSEAGSGGAGNQNAAELVFKSGIQAETAIFLGVVIAGASFWLGKKL